jgi:molybdopterin/thiamine biosynthesis adenylyltransferase
MGCTLVVPASIADRFRQLATEPNETAGVLLARLVSSDRGGVRLLARALHEVPEQAYLDREPDQLVISSEGFVPSLALAEADGSVPIWFHTHPASSSQPSHRDNIVDQSLSDLFRLRAASPVYGALIIAPDDQGSLTFTGHLDDGRHSPQPITRIWETGPRLSLTHADGTVHAEVPELFSRNVRAFGGPVQAVLGDLHIAVIGCGGTGSAVAEQLVRLGVRHIDLIDPDVLTESNLTRVYGSHAHDIGQPKVKVVSAHLQAIAPDAQVNPVQSTVSNEATARLLLDADVVFGCTDDNAGRMVLSRVATFCLTPVIDCGVVLTAGLDGRLDGVFGRVTVLHPGGACLVCRGRIDLARARSEMLSPDERRRLADEGYAPALPGVEPAVVAYTTAVAAAAVAELIERLTWYGPEPVPSEVLLRLHDREYSTNTHEPQPQHYCHPSSNKLGLGVTSPFLEQTW